MAEESISLCPGCRYDLAGHLSAAGSPSVACPECGRVTTRIEINTWADAGLGWSFEHSRRPSVRRWLATSLRVFGPAGFWAGLLGAPVVRPRRWFLFAVLWLFALYAGVIAVFVLTFIANQMLVQGAYSGAPGFDLATVLSRQGWWWPFNKLLFVQIGPNSFVGTPVWSLLLPSVPLLLVPPIIVRLLASVRVVPCPGRFSVAVAGSVELVALWSIGIPLIFAASILLRTAMGLDHAHLIRLIPGAWMAAAIAHLWYWWYRSLRTAAPPGKSVLSATLSIGTGVAVFVLVLLVLEAAGTPV
ncbi:MAG: hypothetical protein AMXMBFR58_23830 [Phycisphaerae bacterium]|nr:hypothetical protein [Phycisphaerales bacterium]